MKNLPRFLQNKNLLFGLGFIFIISLILNAALLLKLTGQRVETDNLSTYSRSNPASKIVITPVPTQQVQQVINNPEDTWTAGENDLYHINYPSGWKPVTKTVLNGGSGVTIKPAILPAGNLLPALHIEATPLNPANPVSEKVKFFSPLKLSKTDITFQGIPAVRLSGTLPFKPLPDNPNKSLIYKDYIFFEKANNNYIITFAYYLDQDASKNVKLYNTMLNSIEFK